MPFPMPPVPFPMPPLFIAAVTDICAIKTFEKLLNILFSEVYCWHFGFTTPLFSATTTDMSLYEVLTLFPYWPLVFRSFLLSPLVARDVITPIICPTVDYSLPVSWSQSFLSLHMVFSLSARVVWCDVCTEYTNLIKVDVDVDVNEMSPLNI